ncbi:hypothetical protein GCM10022202_13240 [Microbacterium marinilacus]|uniref:Uncharacterized protein n=1 Tax=Microbacterium marinilacus TaxID=415209 RepID=A0ABP7BC49_9MICO
MHQVREPRPAEGRRVISEAYADLGGGLASPPPRPVRSRLAPRPSQPHAHDYGASGYCACGLRDTGEVAIGSPAWEQARRGAA